MLKGLEWKGSLICDLFFFLDPSSLIGCQLQFVRWSVLCFLLLPQRSINCCAVCWCLLNLQTKLPGSYFTFSQVPVATHTNEAPYGVLLEGCWWSEQSLTGSVQWTANKPTNKAATTGCWDADTFSKYSSTLELQYSCLKYFNASRATVAFHRLMCWN